MAPEINLVNCDGCQRSLRISSDLPAGTTYSCPSCGHRMTVGQAKQAEQAAVVGGVQPATVVTSASNASANQKPLVYALAGVLLTLSVVGGLWGAYSMGKGNVPEAALVAQESPQQSQGDSSTPAQPLRETVRPTVSAQRDVVRTPDESASSPGERPAQTQPAAQEQEAPRTEDPELPKPGAFGLRRPGALRPTDRARGPASTTVVQSSREVFVPIPVPLPTPSGGGRNAPEADLEVNISWESDDDSIALPRVDLRSNPGNGVKFFISISKKPEADITVKIEPPKGLTSDKDEVSFSAGDLPVEQTVEISGNGQADPADNPLRVKFSASGEGLTAAGSASVPVEVMVRNRFVADNGETFVREDAMGVANPDLSNWTFNPSSGGSVELEVENSTSDFVFLTAPRGGTATRRFRLDDDGYREERPFGSGRFPGPGKAGGWQ